MNIIKAVLGWSNSETHGGNSLRLYALDRGPSPRWAPGGGRTIEQALVEKYGQNKEGDRYLIIRIGDRFVEEDVEARVILAIENELREH